jgi:hypothetical protein
MKKKQVFWTAFLLIALLVFSMFNVLTPSVSSVAETPKSYPTKVELVQKPDDTVRNPYAPPVRHPPQNQYAQMGYLQHGTEKTLLFGKPCPSQRRKWLYYTMVNGIKLSVEVSKRSCTVSPGCDELANGDVVNVDGQPYRVQLYESDMYEYDPFV